MRSFSEWLLEEQGGVGLQQVAVRLQSLIQQLNEMGPRLIQAYNQRIQTYGPSKLAPRETANPDFAQGAVAKMQAALQQALQMSQQGTTDYNLLSQTVRMLNGPVFYDAEKFVFNATKEAQIFGDHVLQTKSMIEQYASSLRQQQQGVHQ